MEVNLKSTKTFRYNILNDSPKAKTVLYVLHGYGQLVKYFIQKFNDLNFDFLIVAPEGMHRFYRKGNSGRVGASWMTKELREVDISDNMDYLNNLDQKISNQYPIQRRILLGFSQGGATALRWKENSTVKFDASIIWASDFANDIEWKDDFYSEENNFFAIGDQDEFFSTESTQKVSEQYVSFGFNIRPYKGTHDIDIATLKSILKNIEDSVSFGTVSD